MLSVTSRKVRREEGRLLDAGAVPASVLQQVLARLHGGRGGSDDVRHRVRTRSAQSRLFLHHTVVQSAVPAALRCVPQRRTCRLQRSVTRKRKVRTTHRE